MAEEIVADSKKSYGQILKTTAVFGSIKVFSLVVGFLKAKIIAVFLGPAGMGVFNLLNYPISLFTQFSSLGISTSGIREVAQAENKRQLSITAEVIKYWNRTLGFIGALVLFCLAPYISKLSFGDDSYSWAFRILSVVVLLNNIGSEYEVLLRGCRETKLIAKAGFFSNLAGFIASIPFYFFWGTSGIIAVILITSLTLVCVNYFYAKKLKIEYVKITIKDILQKGKNMASMGVLIVLGDVMYVTVITTINAIVRNQGGIEQVGFFQACTQITHNSLNIILIAMAADYFPKLSKIQGRVQETNTVLSQQGEAAVLLCTPLIVGMICFSALVIRILLTGEFMQIQEALIWFFISTICRLPIWANKYVILANGKNKFYVILEIINSSTLFLGYFIGYYYWGLLGLAYGFIVQQIIFMLLQLYLCKKVLDVTFSILYWKTLLYCTSLSVIAMLVYYLHLNSYISIGINLGIVCIATVYCLNTLNKRTGAVESIIKKIKNKK